VTGDRDGPALRGASADVVRAALATGDPLPGAGENAGDHPVRGFAGRVDGAVVRDVLGREPLFAAGDAADPAADGRWAFARDRAALDDPTAVPAGTVTDAAGRRVVWRLPGPPPAAPADAVAGLDRALDAALAVDVDAVAFSGGVDSALLAAANPDAALYVGGFEGSHDRAAARAAADAMGRADDLRVVGFDHDDLRGAVPDVVAATGRRNPMDVAIALPLVLVARRAAADGHGRLCVGQGADELLGGYAKHVEPGDDDRVAADTVRGARRETTLTLPDQLARDVPALRAAGVEPVAPFLDDRVVAAALRLPGDLLATPDARKVGLRRAAADRLPDPIRTADKKAVQYGTYVARELDRLARRAGFKRRMADHVGRYIDALVDGDGPAGSRD